MANEDIDDTTPEIPLKRKLTTEMATLLESELYQYADIFFMLAYTRERDDNGAIIFPVYDVWDGGDLIISLDIEPLSYLSATFDLQNGYEFNLNSRTNDPVLGRGNIIAINYAYYDEDNKSNIIELLICEDGYKVSSLKLDENAEGIYIYEFPEQTAQNIISVIKSMFDRIIRDNLVLDLEKDVISQIFTDNSKYKEQLDYYHQVRIGSI